MQNAKQYAQCWNQGNGKIEQNLIYQNGSAIRNLVNKFTYPIKMNVVSNILVSSSRTEIGTDYRGCYGVEAFTSASCTVGFYGLGGADCQKSLYLTVIGLQSNGLIEQRIINTVNLGDGQEITKDFPMYFSDLNTITILGEASAYSWHDGGKWMFGFLAYNAISVSQYTIHAYYKTDGNKKVYVIVNGKQSNGKIEQLLNLNFRTGGWINENTTFSFLLPFTDTNYCITGRPLAESLVSDRAMVFFVLTKYVDKITVTLSNCNLKTNICSSITIIGEQSNGKIEQRIIKSWTSSDVTYTWKFPVPYTDTNFICYGSPIQANGSGTAFVTVSKTRTEVNFGAVMYVQGWWKTVQCECTGYQAPIAIIVCLYGDKLTFGKSLVLTLLTSIGQIPAFVAYWFEPFAFSPYIVPPVQKYLLLNLIGNVKS